MAARSASVILPERPATNYLNRLMKYAKQWGNRTIHARCMQIRIDEGRAKSDGRRATLSCHRRDGHRPCLSSPSSFRSASVCIINMSDWFRCCEGVRTCVRTCVQLLLLKYVNGDMNWWKRQVGTSPVRVAGLMHIYRRGSKKLRERQLCRAHGNGINLPEIKADCAMFCSVFIFFDSLPGMIKHANHCAQPTRFFINATNEFISHKINQKP